MYITWKLLYILATSFCKSQWPVRAGEGHLAPPPKPPLHLPRADLDLKLLVVHLALGSISPWLPPRPTYPLPIRPTPLEDEAVLHCGGRLWSAPRPWAEPPLPTPHIPAVVTFVVPGQVPGAGDVGCGVGRGVRPAGIFVKGSITDQLCRGGDRVAPQQGLACTAPCCTLSAPQEAASQISLTILPALDASVQPDPELQLCPATSPQILHISTQGLPSS